MAFHSYQNKIVMYTKDLSYKPIGDQLGKTIIQFIDPDTFIVTKNITYTIKFNSTNHNIYQN
jgi:hypothetical protein